MSRTVLKQEQLKTLLKTFKKQYAEKYHLRALGYFGSYARDEANEGSDVDIVFETDAPNLFRTATMKQDLEALLGRHVDVVRLRERMNPHLRDRIIREAFYV
jgi:predicted nucleotidyltransferase